MPIKKCFVSQIYYEKLWPSPQTARIQVEKLNQEAYRFSEVDESGREWCEDHYPLGYTCYASIPKLHQHSPHFAKLEKALAPHVSRYLKSLEYDITLNDLGLSSLWVNIMKPHCYHGLHIHPQSVISGTLYLQCPKGSGALKIEDPRHAQMMAAPLRKDDAKLENQRFLYFQPSHGKVILFESWMRHEVEANLSPRDRVSVSFNYDLL